MTIVNADTGEVLAESSQSLDALTRAERMLAGIASASDATDVIALADVAADLARRLRLGTASVNHAVLIKAKAMRRLADIVDAGQAAGQIAPHGGDHTSKVRSADLAPLPIPRQRLREARIIRDAFTDADLEQRIASASGQEQEIATRQLIKAGAAQQTRARREASRNATPLPDAAELRIGDARQVLADTPDASVHLILTDPPYGDQAEPLYAWLGQWAARVLVPGGSLICYTGQSRLDRDMRLLGGHLRYWWLLAMLHHQAQRLPGKFVVAEFKPVLWYVNGHRRGRSLVTDVLRSPARDKTAHQWGQGEGGVGHLIEHLTDPGELVADPFAGSRRWAQIAAGMGRRWLGADVEPGGDGTAVVV